MDLKKKKLKASAIKVPYFHLLKSLIARKVLFGLAVPKTRMPATGPLLRLQRTSSYLRMAKTRTRHTWYRVHCMGIMHIANIRKYNKFLKGPKITYIMGQYCFIS